MKQKPFRVSISAMSGILFLLAALTMFLSGIEVRRVNESVHEEAEIQENRRECLAQGAALAAGSDLLTDEVWRFIATGEPGHLEHYWTEVNETRSREKALEKLRTLSPTSEELACLEMAMNVSQELVEGETWAMRLAAESFGLDPGTLPAEVAAVELSAKELMLPQVVKHQMAMEYIFGLEYKEAKKGITGNITAFQNILQARKDTELAQTMVRTHDALYAGQVLNGVMLLLLLLTVIVVYWLITCPFREYARAISDMEGTGFAPLAEKGSKDTVRFAKAYNRIFDDWKKQNDQLKEEQFRFHVAIENTPMIIFEYLIETDEYRAYGLLDGKNPSDPEAGGIPVERVVSDYLRCKSIENVGEDGAVALRKLIDNEGGTQELPILFNAVMIWARITATPIYDEGGHFVKLIGKITNIDSEREKEQAIEEIRSKDHLTGVYNKETGVRLVQAFMAQKPKEMVCSLMLLDMDGFAQVNETEGSVFADAILMEVADILKNLTGPDDFVIRLGGDEFMVFIKNCSKNDAEILGPQIIREIGELSSKDHPGGTLSASIGSCGTVVVDEYSGLYRCAESTLKYAKEHGKGKAVCYMNASNELGMTLTQVYTERYSLTQIDRVEGAREDMISFALDLLGKSRNLNDALFLLLSRVGKLYDMDRISIIEVDSEYLTCRITQQWTKNPADGQIDEVYYVSREELHRAAELYDADGLSTEYLVGSLRGLGSILHAAIWNRGIYDGFMAFERAGKDYAWSAEERQMLSELIKIISSFTLKARADAVSQAKTEFLSRMSHEIRTPMNAITGMTTIARASLGDAEKTKNCLNKIESANTYLLTLINDILDMSRIESGKMEINPAPADPKERIANLDAMMRPSAEAKGIQFVIEDRTLEGRWIMVDNLRLDQVLINLIGNAVKFTDAGGKVVLRVETLKETDGEVTLRFTVSDTGIGIDQEAQKRIFNAFEQGSANTATSYGGTGLGLAISSRLVQMMGGLLEVKSTPGKGSDFFFTLHVPGADAPASLKSQEEETPAKEPDLLAGMRVLVVEDNEINREIAQEILSMNGFTVETAVDGGEAVHFFQDHPAGYYDGILMDIRMPLMDGFEATRRIRTMGKDDSRTVAIIAMTANAFDEDMKQSLESGMNGHLSKPIEAAKLLDTLRKCIRLERRASGLKHR